MPCSCGRLSFSGLERIVAAVFIIASTSAAIALTVVFGELGLLVLAVSYVVAFFLLVTGITKWRPFKHCCYEKAGKGRASKREPSTKTDLDQDQVL